MNGEMEVPVTPGTITKMQKLIKAEMFGRRQLTVLNIRLNDLDKRLKACKDKGRKSQRYMLKQRRKVTENVRNMYGIFVRRKMMAVARMIITNFSNSMFQRGDSATDTQNNSEETSSDGQTQHNDTNVSTDNEMPSLVSIDDTESTVS